MTDFFGTPGDDILTGTATADIITTDTGNDTVDAGDGDDLIIISGDGEGTIEGGAGFDTVRVTEVTGAFISWQTTTALPTMQYYTTVGSYTFTNIERFEQLDMTTGQLELVLELGTAGADVIDATGETVFVYNLTTGAGADTVITSDTATFSNVYLGTGDDVFTGGDSDDRVFAGEGMDTLSGGLGNDTLYYFDFLGTQGVIVNLGTGITSNDGFGTSDTFSGFENVRGTNFNDTLIGDEFNNELRGEDGNDSLIGGLGADTIYGGEGIDSVNYGGTVGVTVNLLTNVNVGGEAQGDMLFEIENVNGTQHGDNITGNGQSNYIQSLSGDDTIDGGAGDDRIDASFGVDTVTGGAGADIFDNFDLAGAFTGTITDLETVDTISVNGNVSFIGESAFSGAANEMRYEKLSGQTLIHIDLDGDSVADETLTISNGEFDLIDRMNSNFRVNLAIDNTITGTENADTLDGTTGDDTINALGGADTITTFGGDDTIDAGDGDDVIIIQNNTTGTITGGAGFDTVRMIEDGNYGGSGTSNTGTVPSPSLFPQTGGRLDLFGIERLEIVDTNGVMRKLGLYGGATNDIIDASNEQSIDQLQIYGGDGNDTLTGSAGRDYLGGGFGDDVLNGGGGSDQFGELLSGTNVINGGADFDSAIISSYFIQNLNISSTADTLTQSSGGSIQFIDVERIELFTNVTDDIINLANLDVINTRIYTSLGADTYTSAVNGTEYDYRVDSFGPTYAGDVITNFGDDDSLIFSNYDNSDGINLSFIGTAAFTGNSGDIRYELVNGNTHVQIDEDGDGVSDGTLTLNGNVTLLLQSTTTFGPEASQLFLGTNIPPITGTEGRDTLNTTAGDDTVNALGGNDLIIGSAGTDFVDGGADTSSIFGDRLFFWYDSNSPGITTLTGDRIITVGEDFVSDSRGQIDTTFTDIERVEIRGGSLTVGNYTVDGSAFLGGGGVTAEAQMTNNIFIGSNFRDSFRADFRSLAGTADVTGGLGFDRVTIDLSTDATVSVSGSDMIVTDNNGAVTTMRGVEAVTFFLYSATTLDASAATMGLNFQAFSSPDAQVIIGGAGSDSFTGGLGGDTMTGGTGADSYSYTRLSDLAMDGDVITDFEIGDTLNFTSVQFNDGFVPAFIGLDAFNGVVGEIRYETGNGQTLVQSDVDGDGVADATMTLTNGEFTLFNDAASPDDILIRILPPDDFGADTSTTGVLPTNGTTVNGEIETNGDDDWFAVTVSAGDAIRFNMDGVSLNDPHLRLYDASGTLLGENDQFNGNDSQLDYVFATAGTYYVSARGYFDNITGTYTLTASDVPAINGDETSQFLTGTNGIDVINGLGGDDIILGFGGDDILRGGDGNDSLFGIEGNDILYGGAGFDGYSYEDNGGFDRFFGGEGSDIADYRAFSSAIWVDLQISGPEVYTRNGVDVTTGTWVAISDLDSVEGIATTAYQDVIFGNAADNYFEFIDVQGNAFDRFDGRLGEDTVSFQNYDHAVWIDMNFNGIEAWTRGGDTVSTGTWETIANFVSIENVVATGFQDIIRGTSGDNVFTYTLNQGAFGAFDRFDGRGGIDTASFASSGTAVWVDMAFTGIEAWTRGGTDVLSGAWETIANLENFENVTGSYLNDQLFGDAGDNVIRGLDGDDMMTGRAGADTFVFDDNFGFSSGFGNDTITDFTDGEDSLDFSAFGITFADITVTDAGGDTLISYDGQSVTLEGVDVSLIDAADFIF